MDQPPPNLSIAQAGAIPYRAAPGTGEAEVLMIRRRREGQKWGIPKGSVEPGQNHRQAAQMEALQEAGVEGPLSPEPLGNFTYEKQRGVCDVQVFAMEVSTVREHWEEEPVRERRWFPIDQAADVCGREGVARLIRRLATVLRAQVR